jgi:osmotically inducible protein OsmC
MFREAHAVWRGGPYAGEGVVTTPSGVLSNSSYAFGSLADTSRFTSPSEMLAAAIASCMSTMVAVEMAKLGIRPVVVESYVVITLHSPAEGKYQISKIHLEITARTTDLESPKFAEAVAIARRDCPICSALKVEVVCKAKLVSLVTPALV